MNASGIKEAQSKIPAEYHRHAKIFSEEHSQRLPRHTIWDHAIELLPGAPTTLPGRLLPLTQEEITECHKFVEEHLQRGTIRPSKSPYAANFFFVKKKDGKLQPVQDYRPLNKWTIRNRNSSPPIPEVIDQLAGCTLFTKFDVRWGYNNIRIRKGDEWKAAFVTAYFDLLSYLYLSRLIHDASLIIPELSVLPDRLYRSYIRTCARVNAYRTYLLSRYSATILLNTHTRVSATYLPIPYGYSHAHSPSWSTHSESYPPLYP